MFPEDHKYYFSQSFSTLKEVQEILNNYTLDQIQEFIKDGMFDDDLYEALENYFLHRFKQRWV